MKRYECPGVEGGSYLRGNWVTIYERHHCMEEIGWWRKSLIGMCKHCLAEKARRGVYDWQRWYQ